MVQLVESGSEALDLKDCVDEEAFNMLEEQRERKEIIGSLLDFAGNEQFKQLYGAFMKTGMSYSPYGADLSHVTLENLL